MGQESWLSNGRVYCAPFIIKLQGSLSHSPCCMASLSSHTPCSVADARKPRAPSAPSRQWGTPPPVSRHPHVPSPSHPFSQAKIILQKCWSEWVTPRLPFPWTCPASYALSPWPPHISPSGSISTPRFPQGLIMCLISLSPTGQVRSVLFPESTEHPAPCPPAYTNGYHSIPV